MLRFMALGLHRDGPPAVLAFPTGRRHSLAGTGQEPVLKRKNNNPETEIDVMLRLTTPLGGTVSYEEYGSGPPLILVHGAFSNHATNWEFVKPWLEEQFTVYAVARRGRGETDASEGHEVTDEGGDVAALIRSIDEPVFLLGHSYGAHIALVAAAQAADRVRKLVLYEPPWPHNIGNDGLAALDRLAQAGDWEGFASTFFRDELCVPLDELEQLKSTAIWPPIVADAPASHRDLQALSRYPFAASAFR